MSTLRNEHSPKPRPEPPASDRQSRLLLVFMVLVGYIVTFATISGQGRTLTSLELLLGASFGVIYLLLGLNPRLIFDRLPDGWAEGLFFSVQCSLVFGRDPGSSPAQPQTAQTMLSLGGAPASSGTALTTS